MATKERSKSRGRRPARKRTSKRTNSARRKKSTKTSRRTRKTKPRSRARARTPKATPRQKAKVHTVMREFKKGKLKSSSGAKVTSRKQAVAIALSEAGLSRPKRKRRK